MMPHEHHEQMPKTGGFRLQLCYALGPEEDDNTRWIDWSHMTWKHLTTALDVLEERVVYCPPRWKREMADRKERLEALRDLREMVRPFMENNPKRKVQEALDLLAEVRRRALAELGEQTFQIRTSGGMREVRGLIYGPLGVHDEGFSYGFSYAVTHLATGYKVLDFPQLALVVSFCERAAGATDWDAVGASAEANRLLVPVIQRIVEELGLSAVTGAATDDSG